MSAGQESPSLKEDETGDDIFKPLEPRNKNRLFMESHRSILKGVI
jgi:hypothetical protein